MTESHGGARRGAGRPTISASGLVRVPVYLPPELVAVAGTLGGGNVSAGVRAALAAATARAEAAEAKLTLVGDLDFAEWLAQQSEVQP